MKTVENIIEDFTLQYPLEQHCRPDQVLFLDIETTGFTARTSAIYLIGCLYYKDNQWHSIQWFAENGNEQADIVNAFFSFAEDYHFLIHFNGNNFDLPYLSQKCEQYQLPYNFDRFEGIDLYRRISPCKSLLNLPNCKQKTLECYLGLNRQDLYNDGELIGIYQDYVNHPTGEAADILFLHNAEDLKGMLTILPLLAYQDALQYHLKPKKVQANHYRDADDNRRTELLITVLLPAAVPKPVTASACGCYARLEDKEAVIRVPVYEEELKYFYANYKDYYYLPEEDLALHKSVASFVDKEHRIPATAQTCYTRKASSYLRQWDHLFVPFFKKDYQSHELYFELTDEMKKDRPAFAAYASHILNMLASRQS
ncbi:MAG: ribonuclease H-like domain-containing protein [Lachnospiraceae bacterium]|nr:ribonuclease H-like domain-containing protein [Lachnospiraceae bacterium]